ncbi:hypothetical protein [Amycolatopsis sp. DSM 110486]|uniref:hypothetical protein n=1 Tax=Amycolatopsis sp. DSM 110486 TaxID=2865832 RepID=UPI0021051032|nr:hypothetical protein [Amycolatopsis sp. DSM 110486]
MTNYDGEVDMVARTSTENGCQVTTIIADRADAHGSSIARSPVRAPSSTVTAASSESARPIGASSPPTATTSASTAYPYARETRAPPSSC